MSKSSNEQLKILKEASLLKKASKPQVKSSKTPDQFYRDQVEYRERIEMDIELKRFISEMDTKRKFQESQPRANRRSNEIIQEYNR